MGDNIVIELMKLLKASEEAYKEVLERDCSWYIR